MPTRVVNQRDGAHTRSIVGRPLLGQTASTPGHAGFDSSVHIAGSVSAHQAPEAGVMCA